MAANDISRREALRLMGAVGAMAAVPSALSGCSSGSAATSGDLLLVAWQYRADLYRKQLNKVFEKQYSKYSASYQAYPIQSFMQNMSSNFASGMKMDAIMTRDDLVYAWAKAGNIVPLDDLAGAEAYKRDLFPYARESLSVNGKLYGLPYLTVFNAFIYNEDMLHRAGFAEPPKTWNELNKQAATIKKQGIAKYPHLLWMKNTPGINWDFWNYVYANGGDMFDGDDNPVFPDKDDTALRVLEGWVDDIHQRKIVDPGVVSLDLNSATDYFSAGKAAFMMMPYSQMVDIVDPSKSKVYKHAKIGNTPGTSPDALPGESMGYSRMFSMGSHPNSKAGAWDLVTFLGGKDANDEYYFQKYLWKTLGFGYGYQSLSKDAEVREVTKKWMDPAVFDAGNAHAKRRQALKTKWFSEWDGVTAGLLQDALQRKVTPQEALNQSAKKARQLAKG